MASTINSQVTNAVTSTNVSAIGLAAPLSMASTFTSMAESVSLQMLNAVNSQQQGQMVGNATTTVVCAAIVAAAVAGGE